MICASRWAWARRDVRSTFSSFSSFFPSPFPPALVRTCVHLSPSVASEVVRRHRVLSLRACALEGSSAGVVLVEEDGPAVPSDERIAFASTPPRRPRHAFSTRYDRRRARYRANESNLRRSSSPTSKDLELQFHAFAPPAHASHSLCILPRASQKSRQPPPDGKTSSRLRRALSRSRGGGQVRRRGLAGNGRRGIVELC